MPQTASPTGHSSLLDLPSELRLIIYELLFPLREVYVDVVAVGTESASPYVAVATEPHIATSGMALLTACKIINSETTPIFYDALTIIFMVSVWEPHDSYVQFLGGHNYLIHEHGDNLSFHRLWPIESFGAFKHLCRADIRIGLFRDRIGLFGDIGMEEEDGQRQQASVLPRLGEVVRCLNAAP